MIKQLENSSASVLAIYNLEKVCFLNHAWTVQAIQSEFENTFSLFFAYIDNDQTVGYVCVRAVLDELQVGNLAVEPNFRRRGIGQVLIAHLMNYAKQTGKAQIILEVNKLNHPAIELYKKCGFKVLGERKNFYSEGRYATRDALMLCLSIE